MRTLTHPHTGAVPAELDLFLPVGMIELHAEDRADITVTLTPVDPADLVAVDLIEQAAADMIGTVYTVDVPKPTGTGATTQTGVRVSNTGIVNTGVLTTGIVVTGDGNITIGGSSVNGVHIGNVNVNGVNVTSGNRGAVRAVVKVPTGAHVDLETISAHAWVSGPLGAVQFESKTGYLRSTGTIGYLDARTTTGDVTVPVVDHASVATSTGDVRLTLTGSNGQVRTSTGNITIHAQADATVTCRSSTGDITVTHAPGARVRTTARSMTGRVRTGE